MLFLLKPLGKLRGFCVYQPGEGKVGEKSGLGAAPPRLKTSAIRPNGLWAQWPWFSSCGLVIIIV